MKDYGDGLIFTESNYGIPPDDPQDAPLNPDGCDCDAFHWCDECDPRPPEDAASCRCQPHQFCDKCGTREDFKLWEAERG